MVKGWVEMESNMTVKVKILGISGSPRKGHNTEIMVKEALKGAESVGNVETELYSFAGKKSNLATLVLCA